MDLIVLYLKDNVELGSIIKEISSSSIDMFKSLKKGYKELKTKWIGLKVMNFIL